MTSSDSDNSRFSRSVDGVALMIRIMGPEVGAQVLKSFSYDEVKRITVAMSKLEDVSIPDAMQGITGFFSDFQAHSGIVGGGRSQVADLLERALEGGLAKDLVTDIYGDDICFLAERLEWVPADILAKELLSEHVELQAMLFAHLKPSHAGEILKHYPSDLAHEVMYSVSSKGEITSSQVDTLLDLIKRIESSYLATRSKNVDGVKLTADILNRYGGNKAQFFNYLKEVDQTRGDEIEDRMLDFVVLFKQSLETIEVINENVDAAVWAAALKGVQDEERDYILGTMPSRVADEVRSTMVRLGGVPKSKVEEARSEILQVVKRLTSDGSISISYESEAVVS